MNLKALIGGIGLGAGLMYLLDPSNGRRRRAMLRDRTVGLWHDLSGAAGAKTRHLQNRGRGLAHRAGTLWPAGEEGATGGERRLRRGDLEGFDAAAERGSGEPRSGPEAAVVGLTGGALAALGLTRRDQLGTAMKALGAGMMATGLSGATLAPRLGLRERRRAVDIQKSLEIAAPIEQVFAFWRDYENFPRFMSHVRSVRDLGDGRSHWSVVGPAGVSAEWTARITDLVPNERLAWRSEPGGSVEHLGVVHFHPTDGGTRVGIRFCYGSPAGGVGQAATELLGADPRRMMNDDLARLKALLEGAERLPSEHGDATEAT